MNYYIYISEQFKIKERIMLDNIKKHVNIIEIDIENIKNLTKNQILFFDKKNNDTCTNQKVKIIYFNNFISVVKYFLNITGFKYKLNFLNNICRGLESIIVSCGPSLNIDLNKIKEIDDKYIIIAVKYSIEELVKFNIQVDFLLTSEYGYDNFEYYKYGKKLNIIVFHITFFLNKPRRIGDLNFCSNNRRHIDTYRNIIKKKSINYLLLLNRKKKNKIFLFYPAHIMLEMAIPLSILIGCKNIYTIGWDGPNLNNEQLYFHKYINDYMEKINEIKPDEERNNSLEYRYIKKINKVLNIHKIFLYKINNKSPIQIPFCNILKL